MAKSQHLRQSILFLIITLHIPVGVTSAQSLNKAFSYLYAGEYTESESIFRKIISKDPDNPAAAYGLGKVFFMGDNKRYNLDSVNYYATKSAAGLKKQWKTSETKKFNQVGYREFTVMDLQKQVNEAAFKVADSIDEVDGWNHFINTFTTSPYLKEATERRNLLAFNDAMKRGDYASFEEFLKTYPDADQVREARSLYEKFLYKNKTADSTWESYKTFLEKYPKSPYATRAKANYDRLLYLDKTKAHRLQDYVLFIHENPQSPHVSESEDSIYALGTNDKTLESYSKFITAFPGNRNAGKAWEEVYKKETPVFNYESIKKFSEKYPAFPNRQELDSDLILSKKLYFPHKNDSLYGYVDSQSMKVKIPHRFIDASPFSEGMAAVQLPCSSQYCPYSYVTLKGEIIATYPWIEANDFRDGLALVAVGNCDHDSCRYGFINRFGNWVVEPQYDDAFEYHEGLALVRKEGKGYGFIDKKGSVVIPLQYPDATSFSEGVAAVQLKDTSALYGYIDKSGRQVISAGFKKAGMFSESLAPAANEKNQYGYIDHSGSWVIQPVFESALPFRNGSAKVVVKSKDKKNPKLFITREKVIDKKGKYL